MEDGINMKKGSYQIIFGVCILMSLLSVSIYAYISGVETQKDIPVLTSTTEEPMPEIKIMERKIDLVIEPVEEVMPIEEEIIEPVEEIQIIEEVVPVEPIEYVEPIVEEVYYQWQPIDGNFNVFQPSNLTSEQLIYALGDIRSGLISSVDAIIEAERIYGVNALYLTSMLGYESGWGSYENGWNNIAGWTANGGHFSDFESRYDCIMTVARGLAEDFQYTVGPHISGVALRYCPDYGYLDTLLQIMYELDVNI